MKNQKLKKILSISLISLFVISTCSYAKIRPNKNVGIQAVGSTTASFNNWQNLSDEEKKNTIQPSPYSLSIDDSVRKSVYNKITYGVGAGTIPSAYDLNNDAPYAIKNQGNTNECWAFATTTVLETNLKRTRNKTMLLSPRHIDYATSRTFLNGINEKGYNREIGYGNFYISMSYCVSGKGPVLESDMPFEDNENKVNLSAINKNPVLKVKDYVNFADIYKTYNADGTIDKYTDDSRSRYTSEQVQGIRNIMKEHIVKYGAVTGYTYIGNDIANYIDASSGVVAYYNNNTSKNYNHGVTIVGWNDDFSRENFREDRRPEHDGAYLVLNTSTAGIDALSLIAISYDDVWIETANFGVVSTSDIDYDKIYQYDDYGFDVPLTLTDIEGQPVSSGYVANVFSREQKANKKEFLNEVSIYVPKTTNVDIYLNTASDEFSGISKVASAGILEPGYHTVELSTPVELTGNKFIVAAKLTADSVIFATETNMQSNGGASSYWDYATSSIGQSFISTDGINWSDLIEDIADSNVCLKAFTSYQDVDTTVKVSGITLDNAKVELNEGEAKTLVATITPSNASNKNITWTSSNNTIATVSSTGIITAIKEGTVTITATTEDGGKIATCQVIVKGKIKKDDQVYYDDTSSDSSSGSSSSGTSSASSSSGSSSKPSYKDTTIAVGAIPQTGLKVLVAVTISLILITTTCIIFIRIKKLKEVN